MGEQVQCERCGKDLDDDRAVYLELSETDGRYWFSLPATHKSQGGFVFGRDCANTVAADGPQ